MGNLNTMSIIISPVLFTEIVFMFDEFTVNKVLLFIIYFSNNMFKIDFFGRCVQFLALTHV